MPDFVIEVLSPSDRLKTAQAKMDQWMANGVALAWLIDGDNETLYIYRPGQPPERHVGIETMDAGEGPVAGFTADLTDVWDGL